MKHEQIPISLPSWHIVGACYMEEQIADPALLPQTKHTNAASSKN